jgi:hypothetical protein
MIAAVALTLTLQLAPVAEDPATSTHLPMSVLAEGPSHPQLRSWTWIPAGAYGFATFTAGLAGVVVNNEGHLGRRDTKVGNTAMAVGAIVGLIPGILLGQEARKEENAAARAYLPIADVAGSLSLVVGYLFSRGKL